MPRKKGPPKGKYKSLITGKFVSSYYGKRNPTRVTKVEPVHETQEDDTNSFGEAG